MKREDIEKAAREESGIWAPAPLHLQDIYRRDDFEAGFHSGANWRIDSVWHDDLKKGQTNRCILVRFRNGLFMLFEDIRELKGIEVEVMMFAYIDDLVNDTED